jgi:hypothetical protein
VVLLPHIGTATLETQVCFLTGEPAPSQTSAPNNGSTTGAPVKSPKGKLTVKIAEARGLRKSKDPYVVAFSNAPIKRREKIYCDKWIHEGVCAFNHLRCKYKHEIPFPFEPMKWVPLTPILTNHTGIEIWLQLARTFGLGTSFSLRTVLRRVNTKRRVRKNQFDKLISRHCALLAFPRTCNRGP